MGGARERGMTKLSTILALLAMAACSKTESSTNAAPKPTTPETPAPVETAKPAVAPATPPAAAPAPQTTASGDDARVEWDLDGKRHVVELRQIESGFALFVDEQNVGPVWHGDDNFLEVKGSTVTYQATERGDGTPDKSFQAVQVAWDASAKQAKVAQRWECDQSKKKECAMPDWAQ